MGKAAFIENDAGVHVMNPFQGEHTLCGDAFDAPDSESDWEDGEFRSTSKRTVTCPNCAAIILEVRSVRVARAVGGE